jgi:hypothetical protein
LDSALRTNPRLKINERKKRQFVCVSLCEAVQIALTRGTCPADPTRSGDRHWGSKLGFFNNPLPC